MSKEERNREICALFEAGASKPDLSERYGLTVSRIHQILVENGLYEPRTSAEREERARRVEASYRSGKSLREIAREEGVTFQRIHQILRHNGVVLRETQFSQKTTTWTLERYYKIKAMRAAGKSWRHIAVQEGISKEALRRGFQYMDRKIHDVRGGSLQ